MKKAKEKKRTKDSRRRCVSSPFTDPGIHSQVGGDDVAIEQVLEVVVDWPVCSNCSVVYIN